MEVDNPIQQPQEDQPSQPAQPLPHTAKFKKGNVIVIGIILIVFIVGITGFYLLGNRQTKSNQNPSPDTSSSLNQKSNQKTYTNNSYNFKLDIPSDWITEESSVKGMKTIYDDDFPVFKLSSPNGEIIIENTPHNKNNHIKQQLPNTKVQLGAYTVDRYPYINDDGEKIDHIGLFDIRRQKGLGFDFTINGDFEKNNELVLKILKTFAFTKQDPSLDDAISYVIPQGWKKEDTDVSRYISFISSDFHEEGQPMIVTGARISLNKAKRNPAKTLTEQMTLISPYDNLPQKAAVEKNVSLGNNTYLNMYSPCSPGIQCSDTYHTENGGNVWTITFTCNQNCGTKNGIDSTIYGKDRDSFLNTIKFK